jgi:hypothetical protein
MSKTAAAEVRGRVDVLAYRLAERAAMRQCPREWPVLQPHVAALCQKLERFNEPVRALLGAWPGQYFYDPNRPSWLPYWIDTPTESAVKYGLYSPNLLKPQPDPKTPPVPSAPKTKEELTSWTPEQQLERDREAWRKWAVNPYPKLPEPQSDVPWLWIGAGALVLFLLVKR